MTGVVIVDAVRTPIGRFRGGLATIRADHLGALVLNALMRRTGLSAEIVDDVVFGCVTQAGEQSANIARTSLLSAGWPFTIPGMTVDRKCGSSEAAVHVAVGAIASGTADVIVAGGAESMSRVPMGGNLDVHGEAYGQKLLSRFAMVGQGEAAERICDLYEFHRALLDAYSMESHRRAAVAADAGYFNREIEPVSVVEWQESDGGLASDVVQDETIRRDTSLEKLSNLKTVFRHENGRVTAGNASQISDGASALLLMSEDKAKDLGVRPRARIRAIATVGSQPELVLTGPVNATRKVLDKAGLTLNEVDLFEVNEAFAPVPLMWMRELGVGHERLNVNGGAIALGHPLGATGSRIMASLLHELERSGGRIGLQAICCNGGLGTSTIIELMS